MDGGKTGRRLVGWIIILLIACWLFMRINPLAMSLDENDNTILGNFIEWFGAIFGILIALVLVESWAKHSQINEELDKEADALTLLLKSSRALSDHALQEQMATRIRDYAEQTKEAGVEDSKDRQEAIQLLDELHRDIVSILRDKSTPTPVMSEHLRLIHDVIDVRCDRIAHIQDRLKTPLWLVIFFTSAIWLFAFFTLQINSDVLAIFITGGALFTVSILLLIIKDIDGHRNGVWKANFDAFNAPIQEAETLLMEIIEPKPHGKNSKGGLGVVRRKRA